MAQGAASHHARPISELQWRAFSQGDVKVTVVDKTMTGGYEEVLSVWLHSTFAGDDWTSTRSPPLLVSASLSCPTRMLPLIQPLTFACARPCLLAIMLVMLVMRALQHLTLQCMGQRATRLSAYLALPLTQRAR
jgi:hypothetical protein